jgi:hypothetical protein
MFPLTLALQPTKKGIHRSHRHAMRITGRQCCLFMGISGVFSGRDRELRIHALHNIELPCTSTEPECPSHKGENCSDHSWHAGWYRVFFEEYWKIQNELWDIDEGFECAFCPLDRPGGENNHCVPFVYLPPTKPERESENERDILHDCGRYNSNCYG